MKITILILLVACVLTVTGQSAQSNWSQVSKSFIGYAYGVSIDSDNGKVAVAAGDQSQGSSAGIYYAPYPLPAASEGEWTYSPVQFEFSTGVEHNGDHVVVTGVSPGHSAPTAWVSNDDASTFQASDSSDAALSGQDLKQPSWSTGQNLMATVEFNAWANGTLCTTPISIQCSGIATTANAGANWEFSLWGGTLTAGVDARFSASPSQDVIYVAGGMWPSTSVQSAAAHVRAREAKKSHKRQVKDADDNDYRAIMTKSTDGGKTFTTIVNETGSTKGYFNDIGCADDNTCYCISECPDSSCPDASYGVHFWKTADGGSTWNEVYFGYEQSALHLKVISADEVWVTGGPVGLAATGLSWHTTDGGSTWSQETISGGYVFGLDVAADGTVIATTEKLLTSHSSIWQYTPP